MSRPLVLYSSPKTQIEGEAHGAASVVRPCGVVDEDVNFSVVLRFLKELGPTMRTVRFDVGKVTRINSCGVREWLLLMEQVTPKYTLAFENVCELFIDQANVVPRMLGDKTSEILSFQAPYHCPKCDSDRVVILRPTDIWSPGGQSEPPQKTCQECGTSMVFDWLPEEYFGFLKKR